MHQEDAAHGVKLYIFLKSLIICTKYMYKEQYCLYLCFVYIMYSFLSILVILDQ